MTTLIDFAPSIVAAPQFQATLDGQIYNCIVSWNLFGQRYYLSVYDRSQNLIVSRAMVGSPSGLGNEIDIVAGYFTTSTLVFRQADQRFEINP